MASHGWQDALGVRPFMYPSRRRSTRRQTGCSGAEARSLGESDPIVLPDLEAVLPSTWEKVEEPHY